MKAIRSFAVRSTLPEELGDLMRIAVNLRWSWNPRAVELFRWIDHDAWTQAGHDPVRMLGLVSPARLGELIADEPFLTFLAAVSSDLDAYLAEPRWYQKRGSSGAVGAVAYLSPEFGVSEALPTYSGGLGVLAGDHLKTASDLGVPLIGVGLFYRHGYFRQHLNPDGWQQERYPALDPHGMPLTLVRADGAPLTVDVDLAGARCAIQVWRAQVGRIPLFLLDTDVESNGQDERTVTDRLYAGGSEHRLRQEVVLGIGGIRALRAIGFESAVYHSNEGHAGFMGLERIRRLVAEEGLAWDEAIEAVRATTVFTTHTPVPAGIDVYGHDLMKRYFEGFAGECGVDLEGLLSIGRSPESDPDGAPTFNMAVMGFRLAGRANGVSELHGKVSRSMFSGLWPSVPEDEVPITSVTNGVHVPTWMGAEISEVIGRRSSLSWAEGGDEEWAQVKTIADGEIWRARERARERLVYFVRKRLRRQLLRRGMPKAEAEWTDEVLDPGVLTIGFARRFAQYKRATLMLADPVRLKRLLVSKHRPVQFVVAGKAHPLDDIGKEMIRRLVQFAADPDIRARFVFVEDYDMEAGRVLTQGADVWLNTPRRPHEACGTSGMKAVLNGALHCSVLDGWWDETYSGRNGWSIGGTEVSEDDAHQDGIDAEALYDVLEREIVPLFYDRSEGPVPRRWVQRIKSSMTSLGPRVSAGRMVRDYVDRLYVPAAAAGRTMAADGYAAARALAAWKRAVREGWTDVKVLAVDGDITETEVGTERQVAVAIRLGRLSADDVVVQLAHGSVGAGSEVMEPTYEDMVAGDLDEGVCTFQGSFRARDAGLYGYAVRILPAHPGLSDPMEMSLVTWA